RQKHHTKPSNLVCTIKGHIPIRIALPPPIPGIPPFTTFLYVKEHITKHKGSNASDVSSSTLFVANAPANGPICRNLFLQSFFQWYGDVVRVSVAQDPGGDEIRNMEKGDGKFAHVVFSSGKERKRAWKALLEDIAWSEEGILQLDDEIMEALVEKTRILQHLELCNKAMSAYEHTEAEAERRAKQLAEQPDEDGFITVTHGSSTPSFGAANDLEKQQHHEVGKRGMDPRGTGNKKWTIAQELKKKEMQDLKARFEEDLEKVKKMKEERAFWPF
ncbi:hypothetical protein HJC23_010567, partial [Cyclotella cryptica]